MTLTLNEMNSIFSFSLTLTFWFCVTLTLKETENLNWMIFLISAILNFGSSMTLTLKGTENWNSTLNWKNYVSSCACYCVSFSDFLCVPYEILNVNLMTSNWILMMI